MLLGADKALDLKFSRSLKVNPNPRLDTTRHGHSIAWHGIGEQHDVWRSASGI